MKIQDMNKDQVLALMYTLIQSFDEQDGGLMDKYWGGTPEELKELESFDFKAHAENNSTNHPGD